jgi:crotonobetainyl-CoA:carnitine CoA-transferase CaiB-like acyl-CoA transferase
MVVPMAHPLSDALRVVASPMKLSGTPVAYRLPPPLLGQHTDEVVAERGHGPEAIAAWREEGVIA